jgi:hypothetical protein
LLFISLQACEEKGTPDITLRYDENISLEYDEVIRSYKELEKHYPEAKLIEIGRTDIGKPLHLFMISSDRDFDSESIHKKGKCIVMVNNGIHPGEPEGIDACIQLAWDILSNRDGLHSLLDNTVLAIIPVYNIGGALDRSPYYRMNQDGPIDKGRRRNAKNMDLNRDFAKQETKNAISFAKAFTAINPDVFLDTHVTNGSDHQYILTLIPTLHSKMDNAMGEFFKEKMQPELYRRMEENTEYPMIPYVMTFNRGDIKGGLVGYNDDPIYSTGYTSLFNCFSFMTENLVYRDFPSRVRSVIAFITQLMEFTNENSEEIRDLKATADEAVKTQIEFPLSWVLDPTYSEPLEFRGYEYTVTESPLSGRRRGTYDHNKPWVEEIPFYTKYLPDEVVSKPYAYIIPQAWEEIAIKLEQNNIQLSRITEDGEYMVESYYIDDLKSSDRTAQGHHFNSDIKVRKATQTMKYYEGDYVVVADQPGNRYIVEMLEPHAPNSFFAWNFFDSVLESHDFYSVWGFESHFLELLDEDVELRAKFEMMKSDNPEFANDPLAQLEYLYQVAPVHEIEKWNRLYPVARVISEKDLRPIK